MSLCRSALHLAARAGEADVVQALLEGLKPKDQVAYVNELDSHGFTPLFLAQQRSKFVERLRVA